MNAIVTVTCRGAGEAGRSGAGEAGEMIIVDVAESGEELVFRAEEGFEPPPIEELAGTAG